MSRGIPASQLTGEALRDAFLAAVKDAGLPAPFLEVVVDPMRKWRIDYFWPMANPAVALECEGGVWTRGRHTRGKGFLNDMEKYNAVVLMGWRLVRCTPDTLCSVETLDMLRALMPPKAIPDCPDPDACSCKACR